MKNKFKKALIEIVLCTFVVSCSNWNNISFSNKTKLNQFVKKVHKKKTLYKKKRVHKKKKVHKKKIIKYDFSTKDLESIQEVIAENNMRYKKFKQLEKSLIVSTLMSLTLFGIAMWLIICILSAEE